MPLDPQDPRLRAVMYKFYREFFDLAERRRRWSVADDIPWDQTNKNLNPVIADVVEAFCAVEMFLPDYISKALPLIRSNVGWAWVHANWGYEESKHSIALHDWLLKSGQRTDEQMCDLEDKLFRHEWNLPTDTAHGMLIYAMVQELATWLHYRNLRARLTECGEDPALNKVLQLIARDEMAHHAFYKQVVQTFLEIDREATLQELARVLNDFAMPATHMIPDGAQRKAAIRSLRIFDEEIFYRDVYVPILAQLGVERKELRGRRGHKKSVPEPSAPAT
jgi:acyl-[acyl-carrier-protein] desaturase